MSEPKMDLAMIKKIYAIQHPNLSMDEFIDSLCSYLGSCYAENKFKFEAGKGSNRLWWVKTMMETKDYNVYNNCINNYMNAGLVKKSAQSYNNPLSPIAYNIVDDKARAKFKEIFGGYPSKILLSPKNSEGLYEIKIFILDSASDEDKLYGLKYQE